MVQFVHPLHGLAELGPEDGNAGGRRLLLEETDAAARHVAQTGAQRVQLHLQLLLKQKTRGGEELFLLSVASRGRPHYGLNSTSFCNSTLT